MKQTIEYKSKSLTLTATAICASLYAVGCYATAYIPSPWGFGQFRPAVVIPSFFAVVFGSIPAGVGAAVGTLVADSIKHGYLYPGSLFAAVPGNFIGFYLFGWVLKDKFSWTRFIFASNLTLTSANLIVAALYVIVYKVLYLNQFADLPLGALAFLIVGLTIWWFVTMLPFVLLVTPPLIRAAASAFPSIVPGEVREGSLRGELPKAAFSLSMLVPGLIMISIGLAVSYTSLGHYMINFFGGTTKILVEMMFYISGGILSVLGLFFRIRIPSL